MNSSACVVSIYTFFFEQVRPFYLCNEGDNQALERRKKTWFSRHSFSSFSKG